MTGNTGATLTASPALPAHSFWFGEDQGRYVLAVPRAAALLDAARSAGVPAALIGKSGGHNLTLPDGDTISLDTVRATHESFFPAWMIDSSV